MRGELRVDEALVAACGGGLGAESRGDEAAPAEAGDAELAGWWEGGFDCAGVAEDGREVFLGGMAEEEGDKGAEDAENGEEAFELREEVPAAGWGLVDHVDGVDEGRRGPGGAEEVGEEDGVRGALGVGVGEEEVVDQLGAEGVADEDYGATVRGGVCGFGNVRANSRRRGPGAGGLGVRVDSAAEAVGAGHFGGGGIEEDVEGVGRVVDEDVERRTD